MSEAPLPISVEWFPDLSEDDGDVPVTVDVYYTGGKFETEHTALRTAVHSVLKNLRRADRMALVDHLRSHGFASLSIMALDLPIGEVAALGTIEIIREDDRQKGFEARTVGINRSLISMHDKGILVCNLFACGLMALLLQVHGSSIEKVTSDNLHSIANDARRFDLKLESGFVKRYGKKEAHNEQQTPRQLARKFGDLYLSDGENQLPGIELVMVFQEDEEQHIKTLDQGIELFVNNLPTEPGEQVIAFLREQNLFAVHFILSQINEFDTDIAFGIAEAREQGKKDGVMHALVGNQAIRGPDPVLLTRLSVTACFAQILIRAEGSDPRDISLQELTPWIERLGCPVPWKKDP